MSERRHVEVASVSLGPSSRDCAVEAHVLGLEVSIRRMGTDGDLERAARLLRDLDGKVDAIGLGGVNVRLRLGHRFYTLPDGARLASIPRSTPVVDGSGYKEAIEPLAVTKLERAGIRLRDRDVLFASVLDRWPLASAMEAAGARVRPGDALFALGLPLRFPSIRCFSAFAVPVAPLLARLPLTTLYPGARPEGTRRPGVLDRLRERAIRGADVLAGDTHFLLSHIGPAYRGKAIVGTTLTEEDVYAFTRAGATAVASVCPSIGGRAFGANVVEAVLAAVLRRMPASPGAAADTEGPRSILEPDPVAHARRARFPVQEYRWAWELSGWGPQVFVP